MNNEETKVYSPEENSNNPMQTESATTSTQSNSSQPGGTPTPVPPVTNTFQSTVNSNNKGKNTGKTAATNITIKPITIKNNGDRELETGKLFETSFELYPEEAVQDTVAYLGSNIMYSAFPQLSVKVTYNTSVSKRETSYLRTITYLPAYTGKISADVKLDTSNIESSLKCISRATLRTANYLDGHQIAPFDEINLLAGKSLENDLKNTFGQAKPPVVSREDSITKSHRKGENQNADA